MFSSINASSVGFYSQGVTRADLKMEGARLLVRDVLIIAFMYSMVQGHWRLSGEEQVFWMIRGHQHHYFFLREHL